MNEIQTRILAWLIDFYEPATPLTISILLSLERAEVEQALQAMVEQGQVYISRQVDDDTFYALVEQTSHS